MIEKSFKIKTKDYSNGQLDFRPIKCCKMKFRIVKLKTIYVGQQSLTCELGSALIATKGPLSFTALRLRSVHLTFVLLPVTPAH